MALPIIAVAVGIGALLSGAFGCGSSAEKSSPDGAAGEAEGEGTRDAMSPMSDASVRKDGSVRQDALAHPDAPIARDAATPDIYIAPDAGIDAAPDAGTPPPSGQADVNITPGSKVAIFASNFTSPPSGTLFRLNLSPLGTPETKDTFDSNDVVLRYQEGNLYAIDRANAAVHVYDSDFNFLRTIDVGAGSNPQDIIVLPGGEKAYVPRLDAQNDASNRDDVLIINPNTGARLGSLSLLSCADTDGDQLARAAQAVFRESSEELYVNAQDLSSGFSADTNGKVAVINTATNALASCIELTGRNPADITYSEINDEIYVTDTGPYEPDYTLDINSPYGGLEPINPRTHLSEEITIDDLDFDGALSEIRLASGSLGYAITLNSYVYSIASFDPLGSGASAVLNMGVYTSPGYFFSSFSIDALRRLIIAEQGTNPAEAQIRIGPAESDPFVSLGITPGDMAMMP